MSIPAGRDAFAGAPAAPTCSAPGGESPLRARRRAHLQRALHARSLAFIGGEEAASGIEYCRRLGFRGRIFAVNPRRAELAGIACVPTVDDLPQVPDGAWIAVGAEATIDAVARLAAMGAPAAVCYAPGFAEAGCGERERRLIEAAGGMAIVGPNCMGLVTYLDGVPVALSSGLGTERPPGGVALVAQSGTLIGNMVASERSLPVSHLFSMGNQSVLDIADGIDAVAGDPRVRAVLLYVEGIGDAGAFARAAATAFENGKALIALKGGFSAMGRAIALSHTGSLAGAPELVEAFFRRLGVLAVDSFPELLETAKIYAYDSAPAGNRFMVETCSGTDSGYCADLAERHGIALPQPDATARRRWARVLPPFASPVNPVDVTMAQWGDREAQARTLLTMLRQGADGAAVIVNCPAGEDAESYRATLLAMLDVRRRSGLPCFTIANLPEGAPREVREMLLAGGVVPLQGMEDAIACLGRVARHAARRRQLAAAGGPDVRLAGQGALAAGEALDEQAAKRALRAAGLAVPAWRICADAGAACLAAAEIGFPVALKGRGAGLAHKTEAGAVALGLRSGDELRRAAEAMLALPGIDGLAVETMVTDAVAEVIVGVRRDPAFGLALVVGAGGVMAELLRDCATLLLPCSRREVDDALRGLAVQALLAGFRGRAAGDREALLDAIEAVACYALRHAGTLLEMDVNPILVRPRGRGAVAVDAFIRFGRAP